MKNLVCTCIVDRLKVITVEPAKNLISDAEVGIYKKTQESKKTRFRPRKRSRKKEKNDNGQEKRKKTRSYFFSFS